MSIPRQGRPGDAPDRGLAAPTSLLVAQPAEPWGWRHYLVGSAAIATGIVLATVALGLLVALTGATILGN